MWKPIEEFVYPPLDPSWGTYDDSPCVLVWDGKHVREAHAVCQYSWNEELEDDEYKWIWYWASHSTCKCCYYSMDPQPTHFQPMPNPPA